MTLLSSYTLSPQWAFNRWLVVLLVLVAGALVVYLYRAQQKVVSKRVVVALTTIRLLLVLLMFALLAGLSVRWSRTGSAGGTLWLLVDNSASMAQRDPRATAVEKLRWADALGLLSTEFRPGKLDWHAARLAALKADLAYLRTRGELASDPAQARRDADEFAAALREWGDRLRAVADDLAGDADVRHSARSVESSVRDTATWADRMADKAAVHRRRENAAREVLWAEWFKSIDDALAALVPLADMVDARLLEEKSADPGLKAALAKVAGMSRGELAQAALSAKPRDGATAITDLLPRQETKVITFADSPQVVGFDGAGSLPAALKSAAAKPSGQSTNLAAALRYVHDHVDPDEPASVVVLSDGRHNNGGDLIEPARLLASRGVRVFGLALGSQQVAADATVEQLDAPDWVYHEDTLRASALLRLDGLKGKPVTVEFYRGGAKVDSKTVTPAEDRATQVVHFQDKPAEAGVYEYDVRVAEMPDEAVKENNRLGARVAVKKDKLAVLVMEDMPRWEYRHLVNYLSRDQRVKLQTVLLQPARVENVGRPTPVRASPTNEGVEAQLLPQSAADWAAFDFVVLGDVPREALNEQDQQNLAAAVKDRGLTLMTIAGPFNMPQRFAGTALEGLVPVELTGEWPAEEMAEHTKNGFKPAVTPEGRASILGQFTIDEEANSATWAALPAWYWHSTLTVAKRSANVVWTIAPNATVPPSQPRAKPRTTVGTSETPRDSDADSETARDKTLLCTMSVGMGRVMYLASDSTWRMRHVTGGNAHERFWGQVVRFVVDQELPAGGKWVRFGADKSRYVAGENVVVTARVTGDDSGARAGETLKVVARSAGKEVATAQLVELPEARGYYRGSLAGLPAGSIELSLQGNAVERLLAKDPAVSQRTLNINVQSQLGVEQRNVNADPATLHRVAEAAGGVSLDGPYADVVAAHVPKLNYQTERVEQVGLFTAPGERYARLSHWAFLGAFVVLAGAEWIIRKNAGLV